MVCAPSEDSDKTWLPPGLITIFAVGIKNVSVLSYSVSPQHRPKSKRADAGQEYNMSLVLRKPVFGVSDQVPHKTGCMATEDG